MKADIRVGEGLDPPDGKSLIFHSDLSLREQAGQDPPLQEVLRETNKGYKARALYMRDCVPCGRSQISMTPPLTTNLGG